MEKTCAVCGYKLVWFTNLSVQLSISVWFPHPEARRRPDLNIYSHLPISGLRPPSFLKRNYKCHGLFNYLLLSIFKCLKEIPRTRIELALTAYKT
jgi:hypothetical protein